MEEKIPKEIVNNKIPSAARKGPNFNLGLFLVVFCVFSLCSLRLDGPLKSSLYFSNPKNDKQPTRAISDPSSIKLSRSIYKKTMRLHPSAIKSKKVTPKISRIAITVLTIPLHFRK